MVRLSAIGEGVTVREWVERLVRESRGRSSTPEVPAIRAGAYQPSAEMVARESEMRARYGPPVEPSAKELVYTREGEG